MKKKLGQLTIGIISRNGQPFIEVCLQSFSSALPHLFNHFDSIDFILVDSNSSDNTLRLMLDFSDKHSRESFKTDVYLIEGYCNAAIARNIILENCTGDFIFLCDGDIEINYNFIITASKMIKEGKANAVIGQLSEKWFDSDFNFYKSIPMREKIAHEHFVCIAGGIIFISKKVAQCDFKYDENLRRNEDRDFALRVSDYFKILAIPAFVGTHMTQPYYSNERFKIFLKEKYNKPIGVFLKKHMYSFGHLLAIVKAEKGVMVGFIYILLLPLAIALCILHIYMPLLVVLIILLVDLLRYLRKNPLMKFIVYRLISPVMVIQGFFSWGKVKGEYSVKKVTGRY